MMHEKIDLVSQPKKSFWKLSIPIIAFCIFDSIYGIVDMAWITQINIHASFAVGISIPFVSENSLNALIAFLVAFMMLL